MLASSRCALSVRGHHIYAISSRWPHDNLGGLESMFHTTALTDGAARRVIPGDEAQSPSPVEVTAVSRIRGTQRIQEDTKGHGEVGG